MLLPCEDSSLAREVIKRKSHPLSLNQNLPNMQEVALTCIIEKEVCIQRNVI